MVDAGRMQHPLLMEDWQSELVDQYQDGSLQQEANRLTIESGHGRLHGKRKFVDIGGSTGGMTRTLLYDWTPPDVDAMDLDQD